MGVTIATYIGIAYAAFIPVILLGFQIAGYFGRRKAKMLQIPIEDRHQPGTLFIQGLGVGICSPIVFGMLLYDVVCGSKK